MAKFRIIDIKAKVKTIILRHLLNLLRDQVESFISKHAGQKLTYKI